ncbi:unnamed protein product [Euphydryas editha]|uniref:Uncharacterized protein n=1 Tax=Euphydryas editha TaxID=104508 RepID=A0AAU9U3R7_EUPED|nr:unnamed protein product [Euphydryas editha]
MKSIEHYINKTGGIKKAYKDLTNSIDWVVKMKNNSGKCKHHRTDILEIATAYYKKLYECNTSQDEVDLGETSNIPTILQAEVEKATDTQKSDKAPGPDVTDDIRQVAGVMWNRVAQEKREWKRLEEAFADWQTDLQNIKKKHILE